MKKRLSGLICAAGLMIAPCAGSAADAEIAANDRSVEHVAQAIAKGSVHGVAARFFLGGFGDQGTGSDWTVPRQATRRSQSPLEQGHPAVPGDPLEVRDCWDGPEDQHRLNLDFEMDDRY